MLLDCLELIGKKFCMFLTRRGDNLNLMWSEVQKVDSTLVKDECLTKKSSLPSQSDLFFEHCCVCHHYCFQIKKCGSVECTMCKPPKLPRDIFDTIHFLPDPIQGDDGHYMTFEQLVGSNTDESHQPSLQKSAKRSKTLPFAASLQHVKNMDLMLQCDEFGIWRLLYSCHKLTKKEQNHLQIAIKDVSFVCATHLQDLEIPGPGRLNNVYTQKISCGEPIEKLYYTAKYLPICIYCASELSAVPKDTYPQCSNCSDS